MSSRLQRLKRPSTFLTVESNEVPRLLVRLQEALSKHRLDDCLGITNSLQAQLQIMDSQLEERPGIDESGGTLLAVTGPPLH